MSASAHGRSQGFGIEQPSNWRCCWFAMQTRTQDVAAFALDGSRVW